MSGGGFDRKYDEDGFSPKDAVGNRLGVKLMAKKILLRFVNKFRFQYYNFMTWKPRQNKLFYKLKNFIYMIVYIERLFTYEYIWCLSFEEITHVSNVNLFWLSVQSNNDVEIS